MARILNAAMILLFFGIANSNHKKSMDTFSEMSRGYGKLSNASSLIVRHEFNQQTDVTGKKNTNDVFVIEEKVLFANRCSLRKVISSNGNERLVGINRRYGFEISRIGPCEEWSLVSVFDSSQSDALDRLTPGTTVWNQFKTNQFDRKLLIPVHHSGFVSLEKLDELPNFKATERESNIVQIEFDYPFVNVGSNAGYDRISIEMQVDPGNWFLPTGYKEVFKGNKSIDTIETTCRWHVNNGEVASTEFVRNAIVRNGEKLFLKRQSKIRSSYQYSQMSESDFRLTAYGLTEPPNLVPESGGQYLLWIAIATIIVFGVLFWFRKQEVIRR
jgi:hypothetical protein